MKHASFTCIFRLTCAFLLACAPLMAQAKTTITISPLDKAHIQVEYQLSKNCPSLKLQEKYEGRAASLRKDWQALDTCSQLINGDTLSPPKGCRSSRFAVPMSTAFIDRVEPIAYPMDDLGVRIHTGTFGVSESCGDTQWIFKSPKGSVVSESGIYAEKFSASQQQKNYLHYTGVYLSYVSLDKTTHQVFTKRVPAELENTINQNQQPLENYYRKNFATIPFNSPFLLVDNIADPNGFGAQAEVTSPHMIRIGYQGWTPDKIMATRQLQAHEYAHLLQPQQHRPSSPFFHEGGAEFIGLKANYHLGWLNKQDYSSRISEAIQRCIELTDTKTWSEVKHAFGQIPYDCGLAMHTLALAGRQQTESAEQTLANYYTSGLDDSHFARAIECGSETNCTPHFMNSFTGDQSTIASVIIAALQQLELISQHSYGQDVNRIPTADAFAKLMMADCKGSDFYIQQHYFQTGEMLSCNNIPQKSIITRVNGISYFDQPSAAIDAQNLGCSTQHKVTLSNEKNFKITLPCTQTISKTYYALNIDKLLSLLTRRQDQ